MEVQVKEPMLILHGHVLDRLMEMPEGSVHAIVTSPPYHSLRDYSRCPCASTRTVEDVAVVDRYTQGRSMNYEVPDKPRKDPDPACPDCRGTGRVEGLVQIWGAKEGCEHEWGEEAREPKMNEPRERPDLPDPPAGWSQRDVTAKPGTGAFCLRCGAWRGMLGLEPMFDCLAWARKESPCPSCYICNMRVVGAALRQVLREDGVLWWNQGDSYAGGGGYSGADEHPEWWDKSIEGSPQGKISARVTSPPNRNATRLGLKPGDLIDQSGRIANALQADGWVWRGRIVWQKPNPMP